MENTQKIVLRPKDHKKGHKRVLVSLINTGEGAPELSEHSCNLYKGNLFFYRDRTLYKYNLKTNKWTKPGL